MDVTLQTEPPGVPLLSLTYIDLVCDVQLDNTSGVSINFTWTYSQGSVIVEGTDYTVDNQFDNSTLRIEQLSVERDHNTQYTCSVMVVQGDMTMKGNDSVTLNVQGKY